MGGYVTGPEAGFRVLEVGVLSSDFEADMVKAASEAGQVAQSSGLMTEVLQGAESKDGGAPAVVQQRRRSTKRSVDLGAGVPPVRTSGGQRLLCPRVMSHSEWGDRNLLGGRNPHWGGIITLP